MILMIKMVILEQCDRNNQIPYVRPRHKQSPAQKSTSGDWSTMCMSAPTRTTITAVCFQK